MNIQLSAPESKKLLAILRRDRAEALKAAALWGDQGLGLTYKQEAKTLDSLISKLEHLLPDA